MDPTTHGLRHPSDTHCTVNTVIPSVSQDHNQPAPTHPTTHINTFTHGPNHTRPQTPLRHSLHSQHTVIPSVSQDHNQPAPTHPTTHITTHSLMDPTTHGLRHLTAQVTTVIQITQPTTDSSNPIHSTTLIPSTLSGLLMREHSQPENKFIRCYLSASQKFPHFTSISRTRPSHNTDYIKIIYILWLSPGSGRKLQIQVFKWSFNQENVEQTGHKYRVIDAQDSLEQTFFCMVGIVYVPKIPLTHVNSNFKISKGCSTQTTHNIMLKRRTLNNFEILPPWLQLTWLLPPIDQQWKTNKNNITGKNLVRK